MCDANMDHAGRCTPNLTLAMWLALGAVTLAAPITFSLAEEPLPASRLLAPDEGQAIVNAAWEHQQLVRQKPDCSHLVHEIYLLAGFPYPYATSFHLYAGIGNFAPVETPQPGDLIVWPGHVGIVVDPASRSFYGSVGSGLKTDSYDSPYWLGRGPARFYRYVRGGSESLAAVRSSPRTSQAPVQVLTVPIVEEAPRVSSRKESQPEKAAAESTASLSVSLPSTSAQPAFEVPPSIQIVTPNGKVTRDQIAEAISELSNAAGSFLRIEDLLAVSRPVVIFERLQIDRIEVKGDRGWAHVRVKSRASIANGGINLKSRTENRRWELRRTGRDWLAFTPLERVYVPRDVAVRVLAEQLALLTRREVPAAESDSLTRQQAQLARVLHALLTQK